MKKLALLFLVMLLLQSTFASAQSPLDAYIQEALGSNEVLRQKNISLEKAQLSLKQAKADYLPTAGFQFQYTHGAGGRRIAIPIGDLLNGVYATLNELTQSQNFPQVENVSEQLNPYNFYDAKASISMPIYNRNIGHNRRIREHQIKLSEQEIEVYKRDLVRDVKTAYFNYLRSLEAVKIYESALLLAEKNIKVNQSLLKNGSALPAQLIRAESQKKDLEAQKISAETQVKNARAYFNFLLNKEAESSVNADFTLREKLSEALAQNELSTEGREELGMLRTAQNIDEQLLKMRKDFAVPTLAAFADIGSQGFDFEVNENTPYVLAGLQLNIPIFNGLKNKYRIQEAKLNVEDRKLQVAYTARQLNLAAVVASNKVKDANSRYLSAKEQVKAAESYYRLIAKGYQSGVNSQIELIDAQNQLNTSQLQENLALFQIFLESIQLERETAAYTF